MKKNVGFKGKGLEMHFFMRKSFSFPRKWIPWFVGNFYSLKKRRRLKYGSKIIYFEKNGFHTFIENHGFYLILKKKFRLKFL